jgi:hypothetical protein
MSTFGLEFKIISDVIQAIPGLAMGYPPEEVVHHATIIRGLKEYVVLTGKNTHKVWLNAVERHRASFELQEIKDDIEFQELMAFLTESGTFSMGGPKRYADQK